MNKSKTMRIMAVDSTGDGFYYVIQQWRANGSGKMLARGLVKTKGWITRKAKQFRVNQILADMVETIRDERGQVVAQRAIPGKYEAAQKNDLLTE